MIQYNLMKGRETAGVPLRAPGGAALLILNIFPHEAV